MYSNSPQDPAKILPNLQLQEIVQVGNMCGQGLQCSGGERQAKELLDEESRQQSHRGYQDVPLQESY